MSGRYDAVITRKHLKIVVLLLFYFVAFAAKNIWLNGKFG